MPKITISSIFGNQMRRKVVFLILVFFGFVVYLFNTIDTSNYKIYKDCFLGTHQLNDTLEDIVKSDFQPNKGKNIFFHETSCSPENGILSLTSRQACAVESAALMNPHMDVFVLFASKVGFRNGEQTVSPVIQALQSYKNIHFNFINISTYAEYTPLQRFIAKGKMNKSKYFNSHLSDVLRYLSLWKYGGTYLDLDVVVLKPLDSIPPNYAGSESVNYVAAGIISLEHEGYGHQIADMCLRDLKNNFDGDDWGNNGPGVITRVLRSICGVKDTQMMSRTRCYGFNVLPIEKCYSIRWPEHEHFFKEEFLEETMHRVNNSLIVHVWNKHSMKTNLTVDAKVAYVELAKRFCPKVIQSSGIYF